MSQQASSSPETGDKKEKGLEEATVGWSSGVLIGILALYLVFHFFVPDKKSGDDEEGNYTSTSNSTASRGTKTDNAAQPFPPLENIVVQIDETYSEYVDIPEGYYLTFICHEPYEIINGAGEKFEGEANENISIGVKEPGDTSNLSLKFRTRNNSKTTMKVGLRPMPQLNQ